MTGQTIIEEYSKRVVRILFLERENRVKRTSSLHTSLARSTLSLNSDHSEQASEHDWLNERRTSSVVSSKRATRWNARWRRCHYKGGGKRRPADIGGDSAWRFNLDFPSTTEFRRSDGTRLPLSAPTQGMNPLPGSSKPTTVPGCLAQIPTREPDSRTRIDSIFVHCHRLFFPPFSHTPFLFVENTFHHPST